VGMSFSPGDTVLRRYFRDGDQTFLKVTRVVADNGTGPLLWLAAGSTYWRLIDAQGRTLHDAPIDELVEPRLAPLTWQESSVLLWVPPGEAYSIWWFFDAASGEFRGWYVNLEAPTARWSGGLDTIDHALDLWVEPDGSWRWKDMDEFESLTGHPRYWDAAGAAEILAVGERLAALAAARKFPFDGTHCDFRPDPTWPIPGPDLPTGWNAPPAT
jgi:hypothetical protein